MRLKQALNKLVRVKGSLEMQGEIEDMVAAFTEKQRMISSLSGDESGFEGNSGGAMSDEDDFDDSDFEPDKQEEEDFDRVVNMPRRGRKS